MWKKSLEYLRPKLVGSLALLLLAMLSGTASTGVTDHPERFGHQLITATTLATSQLEHLKTLDYRRLAAAAGTTTEGYHTLTDFPTYRRQTTVALDAPECGMTHVTVTVYWENDTQTLRLGMLVAE